MRRHISSAPSGANPFRRDPVAYAHRLISVSPPGLRQCLGNIAASIGCGFSVNSIFLVIAFFTFPTSRFVIAQESAEPKPADASYTTEVIEGWTLHVRQRLLDEHPKETLRARDLLQGQLVNINKAVPPAALAHLHKVPLWFSPRYPGAQAPRAEYHPNAQWLRNHDRDPQMAKAVEFTNIETFEREERRMPWFVLHELAHAFHDQVLGFDNPEVIAAYEQAVKSGAYDNVKRWTGVEEVRERAYAMTNHREYFAENSEAYFGRNDFEPFDRAELEKMDPAMLRLLERLWNSK